MVSSSAFSHATRMGIDLGEITQLFHVYPLLNREYVHTTDGKYTLAKNWSKVSLAVAPKTIVENICVHKRALPEHQTFENVFTRNSTVFMMNSVYYGSQGSVIDPTIRNGRLTSKQSCDIMPDRRILSRFSSFRFSFSGGSSATGFPRGASNSLQ